MYTPALAPTAAACGLIALVVIPVAVLLGRRIALGALAAEQQRAAERSRGGVAPAARRLGEPRPAHAARRDPGDERGARGRRGRRSRRDRRLRAADQHRDDPARRRWWTTCSSCPGSTPGRCRSRFGPVSTEELVAQAMESAAPAAEPAQHPAHRVRADPRWPVVRGSDHELIRVLRNLLVNAIRHTPSTRRSRWSPGRPPTTPGSRCRTGAAASMRTDLPRVFDVAFRGTAARTPHGPRTAAGAAETGAGLGLAIAQGLVHAHGGEISVRNARPRLPVRGAPPRRRREGLRIPDVALILQTRRHQRLYDRACNEIRGDVDSGHWPHCASCWPPAGRRARPKQRARRVRRAAA